jgi:hypothetical protein
MNRGTRPIAAIVAPKAIRSDIFGVYLCTVAEAEETDNGTNPSAGYDLRSHWQTPEEAVSALRDWRPVRWN